MKFCKDRASVSSLGNYCWCDSKCAEKKAGCVQDLCILRSNDNSFSGGFAVRNPELLKVEYLCME